MDLTFTVAAGPKVFVPVDGPWLPMIVEHLVGRKGEEKQKQYGDDNFGSLLQDIDKGRVSWRTTAGSASSQGGWLLRYYAASKGKHRSTVAKLHVPRHGLSGEILATADVESAAAQVLRRARLMWNRLDESEGPRYVI